MNYLPRFEHGFSFKVLVPVHEVYGRLNGHHPAGMVDWPVGAWGGRSEGGRGEGGRGEEKTSPLILISLEATGGIFELVGEEVYVAGVLVVWVWSGRGLPHRPSRTGQQGCLQYSSLLLEGRGQTHCLVITRHHSQILQSLGLCTT